jgi:hypothetical protein
MANLAKWNEDTAWTSALAAATDLDTKTTGTAIAVGANIDNATQKALYMDVSLILGSFTPGTSGYFELHLLPLQSDATNYADRTSGTRIGTLLLSSGASAKYVALTGIPIPGVAFKLQLVSQAGATTAGSGNSFKYRLTNFNLNG